MGFFRYLFWGGIAGYGIHKIRQANEEEEQRKELQRREEAKRKSCVYQFDQGLSEDEFHSIVYSCVKKIKRIEKVEIDGLKISCIATSQSGITQWSFLLDYNDYGKLTGKCYLESKNGDSNIPERLNVLINEKLEEYIENLQQIEDSAEDGKTSSQKKKKIKKDKSWIAIIICTVIVLGFPFGMMLKFEVEEKIAISEGKINAGFYKDLIGEDYKTVQAHFDSAGFTEVELIDLNDSGIFFWKDGKVDSISISGNNAFESTDWFKPDSKVVISYH